MSATQSKRWPVIAGVFALLAVHYALALSASIDKTPGFDEVAHVAAGVSYWKFNDYRLHPENGNLPQRLAGAAIVAGGVNFPESDPKLWRESRVWDLGPELLFRAGNDAQAVLIRGRAAISLLSLAIGALIFAWSRRLFGTAGAFVSLSLWTFCPVALANAAMVTSDMAAALGLLIAVAAWWRVLGRITPANTILAGAATGVAMLSKMSGLLALPMAVMLVLIRLAASEAPLAGWRESALLPVTSRLHRLALYAAVGIVAALVSGAMIWASFGFRHRAFANPPGGGDKFLDAWVWTAPDAGGAARLASRMNNAGLLPEAWLYGVAFQSWVNQQPTPTYLNGQWADRGFVRFFPEVFALKMPLAFFGLAIIAAITALGATRKRGSPAGEATRTSSTDASSIVPAVAQPITPQPSRWSRVERGLLPFVPLLVLVAVYMLAACTSPRNAGVRHILPLYPAVFIFLGVSAWFCRSEDDSPRAKTRSRARMYMLAICIVFIAGETLAAWPSYAAFFNAHTRGIGNAYRVVVDSSLDWGQELINLRRRLESRGDQRPDAPPVYLAYFGTGSPEYYGIRAIELPGFGAPASTVKPRAWPEPLRPGVYCVSATLVQSLYVSPKGPWARPFEATYQALRPIVGQLAAVPPGEREPFLKARGIADERTIIDAFEQARFKRLCAYLRHRDPDDHVNGSMLIYELDQAELDRALLDAPAELVESPVIVP